MASSSSSRTSSSTWVNTITTKSQKSLPNSCWNKLSISWVYASSLIWLRVSLLTMRGIFATTQQSPALFPYRISLISKTSRNALTPYSSVLKYRTISFTLCRSRADESQSPGVSIKWQYFVPGAYLYGRTALWITLVVACHCVCVRVC